MEAVRLLFWWRGFSTAQEPEGGLALTLTLTLALTQPSEQP